MRLPTNLLGPPRTFYRIPLDPLHTLNRSRPPPCPYRVSTDPLQTLNLLQIFWKPSTKPLQTASQALDTLDTLDTLYSHIQPPRARASEQQMQQRG